MKVVVGSGNKGKVRIVEDALKYLHLDTDVEGVRVSSGILEQILSRRAVRIRAINRAKSARGLGPGADF